MATNQWTSDRRLYLDAQGRAVEAKDPTRVSLLVAAGGTIPLAEAQRLGLVAAPEPIDPEKQTPANKGRGKPPANKGAAVAPPEQKPEE